MDNAISVGIVFAQVIDFTGEGMVGGIHDVELCPLHGLAGGSIDFLDRQARLLIVLELYDAQLVGLQGNLLRDGIKQVFVRNGLFGDLINAGIHLREEDFTVGVRSLRRQRAAVDLADSEGCARNRLTGDCVLLDDFQVRLFFIIDDELGVFAGEQLDVILGLDQHIPGRSVHLHHRVDAGFQILNGEGAIHIGDPIQIVGAILDLRYPEGGAGKPLVQVGIVLDHGQ